LDMLARPVVVVAAFLLASVALAQTPTASSVTDAKPPAFEVASIKPWDGNGFGIQLRFYIQAAFAIPANSNGLLIGPGWINNTRYVIEAKPPDSVRDAMKTMTAEERNKTTQQMQQSLLADRFNLKAHFETREMPEYELVVAKGGLKMKENSDTTHSGYGLNQTGIKGSAIPLPMLTSALMALPDIGGRVVIDKTGLTGRYDVSLKCTPMSSASPGGAENATDPDSASLFTAIEEQLGLKLVPIKGPVKILVIDHIEQPSPN
jgi:bla regulator protein blaR1